MNNLKLHCKYQLISKFEIEMLGSNLIKFAKVDCTLHLIVGVFRESLYKLLSYLVILLLVKHEGRLMYHYNASNSDSRFCKRRSQRHLLTL